MIFWCGKSKFELFAKSGATSPGIRLLWLELSYLSWQLLHCFVRIAGKILNLQLDNHQKLYQMASRSSNPQVALTYQNTVWFVTKLDFWNCWTFGKSMLEIYHLRICSRLLTHLELHDQILEGFRFVVSNEKTEILCAKPKLKWIQNPNFNDLFFDRAKQDHTIHDSVRPRRNYEHFSVKSRSP